ncbi:MULTISPECIES: hypothetical protein [unclassified Streptomyces]|uniref:hypothetical protein n=1 Tax=unclassified Streptomyces TaxID=2593676 RepID=UPI0006B02852|nr:MULTISPECIES: hypothetical protein [unclassified Streptomyces]KOX23335.1 hypothetical protein ADL06_22470 [Streptomyces sp. NRRL F-6491]KOX42721.1 hypothetical protein ADL08_15230 [Streptomyces sp. NRRL F-6492]
MAEEHGSVTPSKSLGMVLAADRFMNTPRGIVLMSFLVIVTGFLFPPKSLIIGAVIMAFWIAVGLTGKRHEKRRSRNSR